MKITSLRVTEKVTKSKGNYPDIPYLIVNVTWKVPADSFYFTRFLRDSKEINEGLIVENPEWYEDPWLHDLKYKKAWIPQDQKWIYLEKFDTFWLKEYMSDNPVVRCAISELSYFHQNNKLPVVYRFEDESILYKHLMTLYQYND